MRAVEILGASKDELEVYAFGTLKKAVLRDIEYGSMMCGQIAGMINEIKSVKEVIEDLMKEYVEIKGRN